MRRRRLTLAGGIAAALLALILIVGLGGLAFMSAVLRPWLAVLLGINGGVGDVTMASLQAINPIDIAALALCSLTFAGFWPGPGRPHRVWMGIAIVLPLAGIAVLLATDLWGRSGLMSAGIILSSLMLADRGWRGVGYVGLSANLLLLAADFTTLGARSLPIAGVAAIGYFALVTWFAWIAANLLFAKASAGTAHT